MTELKPCPFCGGTNFTTHEVWASDPAGRKHSVMCLSCRCVGPWAATPKGGEVAWGIRHESIPEPETKPDPKPEFDPSEDICPWCGLEVDSGRLNKRVSIGDVTEAWHYGCRAAYWKLIKSKGWLRRFLEWIWFGERV